MSSKQYSLPSSIFRIAVLFVLPLFSACINIPTEKLSETKEIVLTQIEPLEISLENAGWQSLETGLEIYEKSGTNNLFLARFDPAYFRIDVEYSPGEPIALSKWMNEMNATAVINGGYFMENFYATGLTIYNGDVSGWNYEFGGMLLTQDGEAVVRSNTTTPYQEGEPIEDALQAFPMLLENGQPVPQKTEDYHRRSAVGIDNNGHIVFILAPLPTYSYQQLSEELASEEYNLHTVLNLDGGSSSGILFNNYEQLGEPSFSLLPQVLVIRPK